MFALVSISKEICEAKRQHQAEKTERGEMNNSGLECHLVEELCGFVPREEPDAPLSSLANH